LSKYPRSIVAGVLTGLSSTGVVGAALWGPTLLVLVAEGDASSGGPSASSAPRYRMRSAAARPVFFSPCRCSVALAGYLHNHYIGTISVLLLMLMVGSVFHNSGFSVVLPLHGGVVAGTLRASGYGLVYG
jgi:hypothetical protein